MNIWSPTYGSQICPGRMVEYWQERIESGAATKEWTGNEFLMGRRKLKKASMGSFGIPYKVGDDFMSWCVTLEEVKYNENQNILSIGDRFMMWNNNVRELTLPWEGLKRIGHSCLLNCKSLESLDLSKLVTLEEVGDQFAMGCDNLKRILWPCTPYGMELRDKYNRSKQKK